MDAAARRDTRPVRRRRRDAQREQRPGQQGGGRQGDVDPEDGHDRRPDRLQQGTGAQRLAWPDHRHPVGQGAGRLAISARISDDRERHRSRNVADPGETQAVQQLTARRSARTVRRATRRWPSAPRGRPDEKLRRPRGAGRSRLLRPRPRGGRRRRAERRREDDPAQRPGRRPCADRRQGALSRRGRDRSRDRGALPARAGAHPPDPKALQRHDGVRERLHRRRPWRRS